MTTAAIARFTGALCALLALAAAATAPAATADATRGADGYTYFNRPGASAADYDRDLADCVARGVAAFPDGQLTGKGQVSTSNVGVYGGIVPGMLANVAYQAKLNTNLQNCMTVLGWRVMRLDEAAGSTLWARPPAEIRRELVGWVGAAAPPGEAVRSYENDLARRGAVLFVIRPFPPTGLKSLSLKAFDPTGLELHPTRDPQRYGDEGSRFVAKPLAPGAAADASPTEAIAIVSWSGKPASKYEGFEFRRFGPTADLSAFGADGRDDEFLLLSRHPSASVGERRISVISLPPGRWRLLYRGGLELCLGAPSFEARAGEVLWLGHFDFDAATLSPDMAFDAKTLPLAPALLGPTLLAKARPAAWVNGARWPCHFGFIHFAQEFPGFPAEPGYRGVAAPTLRP